MARRECVIAAGPAPDRRTDEALGSAVPGAGIAGVCGLKRTKSVAVGLWAVRCRQMLGSA
jgi:hypothetical protein